MKNASNWFLFWKNLDMSVLWTLIREMNQSCVPRLLQSTRSSCFSLQAFSSDWALSPPNVLLYLLCCLCLVLSFPNLSNCHFWHSNDAWTYFWSLSHFSCITLWLLFIFSCLEPFVNVVAILELIFLFSFKPSSVPPFLDVFN